MSRTVFCPYCQLPQALESQGGESGEVHCDNCGRVLRLGPQSAAPPATVLWIDDDRLVLGACVGELERAGFRTFMALDGPTGIEIAKKKRPDVILLDVVMPTMTGFEVCQELRADPNLANTLIVLLTALEDPGVRTMGEKVGATTTLRKPFGPEYLIEFLEKLLDRPSGPPRL
jgi:DNA-binding response OmpR family regulator